MRCEKLWALCMYVCMYVGEYVENICTYVLVHMLAKKNKKKERESMIGLVSYHPGGWWMILTTQFLP